MRFEKQLNPKPRGPKLMTFRFYATVGGVEVVSSGPGVSVMADTSRRTPLGHVQAANLDDAWTQARAKWPDKELILQR